MTEANGANTPKQDGIEQRLAAAGIPSYAIEAVFNIDAMMQSWRRRMSKRELGLSALKELGLELDLAQLDVLVAIAAPRNEFGTPTNEETMVGTVADRLGIDPSRASRLVSEMVEAGYVQRAASQCDSRRTVISLTTQGAATVDAVRTHKFLILGEFMSDWSEEEVATFLPLLARFSAWTDRAIDAEGARFHSEIKALADELAEGRAKQPAA